MIKFIRWSYVGSIENARAFEKCLLVFLSVSETQINSLFLVYTMIDFDKLIDEHLKKEARPKGVGKYYPSSAGTCMRKVWYGYKYTSELEPELLKIFEMGNIIHDFVVEVLKSEKTPEVELLESEFPFKEEVDLTG